MVSRQFALVFFSGPGDVVGSTPGDTSRPRVPHLQAVTSFEGSADPRQDDPRQHA